MRRKLINHLATLLALVVALNCLSHSSLAGDARKAFPLHESFINMSRPLITTAIFPKMANAVVRYDKRVHHQPGGWLTLDDEAELFINVETGSEILSGSNVTYTITVTNEGTGAATAFAVADELPSETTFVSCEATAGGVCGGSNNNRSVSFETLAPAASATILLVATVNCLLPDDTEIRNTAEIHPLTPDPEADEVENDTVFVTVRTPPHLRLLIQRLTPRCSGRQITS